MKVGTSYYEGIYVTNTFDEARRILASEGIVVTAMGEMPGIGYLNNCQSWRQTGQHHKLEGMPDKAMAYFELVRSSLEFHRMLELIIGRFQQVAPKKRRALVAAS